MNFLVALNPLQHVSSNCELIDCALVIIVRIKLKPVLNTEINTLCLAPTAEISFKQ